jgi:hypothetical protein
VHVHWQNVIPMLRYLSLDFTKQHSTYTRYLASLLLHIVVVDKILFMLDHGGSFFLFCGYPLRLEGIILLTNYK